MPAADLSWRLASDDAAAGDVIAVPDLRQLRTLACPTCFCTTWRTSPTCRRTTAERGSTGPPASTWTSLTGGGAVHPTTKSRYRQWLTHKLGTWHDQFGSSGCVGCGRCIVWCPVGIDITEEVAALQAEAQGKQAQDAETQDGAQ
jgi:ferredoxin